MKYIKQSFLFTVLSFLLVAGVSIASSWVGPTAEPPNNNVSSPINVSSVSQTKTGALSVGGFSLVDSTQGAGKILTSDADGKARWETQGVITGGVPQGAVMFFNLSSCPSGWSVSTNAKGRYLVGLNDGGSLGATVGDKLSNGENRATGEHRHNVGVPTGSPLNTEGSSHLAVGYPLVLSNSFTGGVKGGAIAGTNAPYVQFLVCQKN